MWAKSALPDPDPNQPSLTQISLLGLIWLQMALSDPNQPTSQPNQPCPTIWFSCFTKHKYVMVDTEVTLEIFDLSPGAGGQACGPQSVWVWHAFWITFKIVIIGSTQRAGDSQRQTTTMTTLPTTTAVPITASSTTSGPTTASSTTAGPPAWGSFSFKY